MTGRSENHPLKEFYSDIYLIYDRVNRVFTFGRDMAWRRRAVEACLVDNPGSVLDVCTGTGDFILEAARQLGEGGKDVRLTGYDFNREMLREADRKQEMLRLSGTAPEIDFMEGDAGNMPFGEGVFDAMGITFGIRNLLFENPNAERHLRELFRVLKPGGRLVILESSRPGNPVWRLFNNIYLRFFLPLLGGVISGNLQAYRYLARSSRNYYTRKEMCAILEGAGFRLLGERSLFLGSVMLVEATR